MTQPEPEEQKRLVKEAQSKSELKLGDSWYVISSKWWNLWSEYVGFNEDQQRDDTSIEPGAIENDDLLADPSDTSSLLPDLRNGLDYVTRHHSVWKLLVSWYGGGPAIERNVVSIGEFNTTLRVDVFPITITFRKASSGQEPKHRLHFSRETTLSKLRARVCRVFYVAPHNSRLWLLMPGPDPETDPDECILIKPEDESATIEQRQIPDNCTMLLESKDHHGEWRANISSYFSDSDDEEAEKQLQEMQALPERRAGYPGQSSYSSSYSSSSRGSGWSWGHSSAKGTPTVRGSPGLHNLGNTCFMNSALQCLVNTKELSEFFLTDEYVEQINRDNPLGMKGLVADSYSQLVKDMWSNKYKTLALVDFKVTIGKFRPQFSGYAQQDSQEFLGFLLDGLHEDLNRARNKPPTETIESNGRPDHQVAKQSWKNHLLRHNSVVVDLFQGQFKSRVECLQPECDRVSVTFDPFMYLSVPLPVSAEKNIRVRFVYQDVNKTPKVFGLKVPKRGSALLMRKALAQQTGVDESRIHMCDIHAHRLFSIITDRKNLSGIQPRDVTFAFELIQSITNDIIDDDITDDNDITTTDDNDNDTTTTDDNNNNTTTTDNNNNTTTTDDNNNNKKDKNTPKNDSKGKNSSSARDALRNSSSTPPDILPVQLVHRQVNNHGRGTLFYEPMLFSFSENDQGATAKLLHQRIFAYLKQRVLINDLNDPATQAAIQAATADDDAADQQQTLPTFPTDSDHLAQDPSPDTLQSLYTLHYGPTSNYSRPTEELELLPYDDKVLLRDLLEFNGYSHGHAVMVSWSKLALDLYWNKESAEKVDLDASAQNTNDTSSGIPLEECVERFSEKEYLKDADVWYCSKCKQHREASKQLSLFSLPQYLVIHLKRFQYDNLYRTRIDDLVVFPKEGLDMSKFSPHVDDGSPPPIYDLYGVSNHSGGLRGGHYTAYVMNPTNGKWYYCNDSSVSADDGSDIVSSRAYLLFYKRRGLGEPAPSKKDWSSVSFKFAPPDDVKGDDSAAASSSTTTTNDD